MCSPNNSGFLPFDHPYSLYCDVLIIFVLCLNCTPTKSMYQHCVSLPFIFLAANRVDTSIINFYFKLYFRYMISNAVTNTYLFAV